MKKFIIFQLSGLATPRERCYNINIVIQKITKSNQEGGEKVMPSIEKRGKNSYRLVVFHGYDLNGKVIKHQKTIHCKNKSEAQIELAKYVAQIETGMVTEGRVPTFKEFVEIWKRDYGSKELAPATNIC